MLTKDDIAKALPVNLKSAATQNIADLVNNMSNDPLVAEQIRNNFVSYTKVMQEGKFKTEDYVYAVTYISYKLMGYTNGDAYFKTFPKRHADLVARGYTTRDISSYVAAYNRGKLVNLIYEQSLIPTWVLNQDIHQQAVNRLADLMHNAASEKVQSDSAAALLTHLAKPKDQNFQLNVDMRDNSGMNELKETLGKLAEKQLELINSGVLAKDIVEARIIEAE